MLFWGMSLTLAALALAPVLAALLRPQGGTEARQDIAIYRDQLAEVDRDVARGVVSGEEAGRLRLEVQRRLLEADGAAARRLGQAPARVNGATAALLGVAVIGGALGLYVVVGAPGYPDLPIAARLEQAELARAGRPAQAAAEAQAAAIMPPPRTPDGDFAELMQRLRTTVAERPGDLEGQLLLARNEAALGDFVAARSTQERAVEIMGEDADADALSILAELTILAAGGFVTNEAEAVLDRALALSPTDDRALYYKGLANAQIGRPDLTFRIWRQLLETSAPDAPWIEPIRSQIGSIARRAGIRYTAPAPAGPDPDAIANAQDMTPKERQQMIEGMVSRLSDRLATEGGPPSDWARLIASYGVLGRTERARAIWQEAQQVFGDSDEAVATIRQAAVEAGVAQ